MKKIAKKTVSTETEKRTLKDTKIGTRIMLSGIATIVAAILVIAILFPVFFSAAASYFNMSTVTTNSFGSINQIQWDYTLSQIAKKLTTDKSSEEKIDEIEKYIKPIEKLGSIVEIRDKTTILYATNENEEIAKIAKNIVNFGENDNIIHMGSNGLVIINHVNVKDDVFTLTFVNTHYEMSNSNYQLKSIDILRYLTGKTGIIILIVAMIFVAAALIVSIITSRSINKPLKAVQKGVEEFASGNFDYNIEYNSKNEIGEMADAFNNMKSRLVELIESQQKMEHSRQIMIAGVTHDLRTPLTSIKGYVEGLIDKIADTPEKQDRYLKTIYSSALDMEKLINDLFLFSTLDLGTIELQMEKMNIGDFFDDFYWEIQTQYQKDDSIEISYSFDCLKNTKVYVDSPRFSRVVENLVSNSIKYRKKLEKCKIEITVTEYEKSVIIEFKDNGIGVDEKNISHIFETFYREDEARSKVREGSGIGLSICKQIVELHGGTIWAKSNPDSGLIIYISLPKIQEEENEKDIDN